MMWWGDGWGGGGWGWFALMHILWWALIIFGIAGWVRWTVGGARGKHQETDHALHILRERYARGEISKDEYEERKQVLKG